MNHLHTIFLTPSYLNLHVLFLTGLPVFYCNRTTGPNILFFSIFETLLIFTLRLQCSVSAPTGISNALNWHFWCSLQYILD